ncbi:nucleotide exchange factor SIL1 precursor [Xenopus laevis]|uniref:Nucleotide exchange factor SIL1 n=1 Tax=Xenopus laevis TaxID=8355 RepID=SIL1_XENLA|nr:nucleotide exchange factor SIL1 precursor [Xenopus laevis]Q6NUA7.1 RecName: Full=Nucleotide exchange factor SIL1; Flags: Precursor [Xenopus laevis]AAH68689.1 MGC81098 protein [Xenopus laevis]
MDLYCSFIRISNHVKMSTFILLTLCFYVALSDRSPEYALTKVTEAEDDGNVEAIVENEPDPEDQEIFYPTREWQVVKPGQAVPAGLHMRLNLQTGKNEAKLLEEKEGKDRPKQKRKSSTTSDKYTKKELKEALTKFKEGAEQLSPAEEKDYLQDIKQRFRPIEDLQKAFNDLNINVETDFEIMTKIVNRFNSSSSTTEKVSALYDLEYYVHQVDNAQNLLKLGALQLLINSLNSTDTLLIENSAFVIGSALSSNPKVQIEAFEAGALQKLLVILAADQEVSVKKKTLYALSSMLRQFPYAQQRFMKLGGLQILKNFFKEKNAESLYIRVITLLYDMIMEKMLLYKENNTEQYEQKYQQYNQINLLESITEQGWCPIISDLLRLPENDSREKVLKAVLTLIPLCRAEFLKDCNLLTLLNSLRKEYEGLAAEELRSGEQDGYFSEILSLTISITDKLK